MDENIGSRGPGGKWRGEGETKDAPHLSGQLPSGAVADIGGAEDMQNMAKCAANVFFHERLKTNRITRHSNRPLFRCAPYLSVSFINNFKI
jgi:hypothetical protein